MNASWRPVSNVIDIQNKCQQIDRLHALAAKFDGKTTGRPQSYLPASPIPAFRLTYKPNFSY